jgi:hypothetical protein
MDRRGATGRACSFEDPAACFFSSECLRERLLAQ